jgi:hypothetical protein
MNALEKSTNAIDVTDGFDIANVDPTSSPLRGVGVRFIDGNYTTFGAKFDVSGRKFIVLDRREGWQKLEKDCPPEYLMRMKGEPRPPQPVVPEKDWPLNLNKVPEHPWKLTLYLYLLDAVSGEVATFWTNTKGGYKACGMLQDQISFMREIEPTAIAVIALEAADMPTQYGTIKPRPHFKLLKYRKRQSIGPVLITGPDSTGEFEHPTSAEAFDDDDGF